MRAPLRDLAQQLLEDIVVRLRPMRAAPDLPEIDDVADEIDRVRLDLAQKIEQRRGLRCACAEVHVGDEQRAIVRWVQRRSRNVRRYLS